MSNGGHSDYWQNVFLTKRLTWIHPDKTSKVVLTKRPRRSGHPDKMSCWQYVFLTKRLQTNIFSRHTLDNSKYYTAISSKKVKWFQIRSFFQVRWGPPREIETNIFMLFPIFSEGGQSFFLLPKAGKVARGIRAVTKKKDCDLQHLTNIPCWVTF